jgi:hypothetical protein
MLFLHHLFHYCLANIYLMLNRRGAAAAACRKAANVHPRRVLAAAGREHLPPSRQHCALYNLEPAGKIIGHVSASVCGGKQPQTRNTGLLPEGVTRQ